MDEAELDRHHDDDAEPDRIEAELMMTGKMIGTVRRIMASSSMRHPSTRYIDHHQRQHAVRPDGSPIRNSVTFCGVCVIGEEVAEQDRADQRS